MAYARSVTSGRERSASTLVNGGHATGDRTSFSCLFCDLPVSLVRRRGCAHFRHAAGTSCLFKLDAESAAEREEIEELAKTRIANRSSDFCRRWRSLFPEECRKGRRHARPDDGKAHVPDVELGAGTAGSAVIEIQHSVVPASDLVSRERAYPNDVTWILDCTSIVFHIEETVLEGRALHELVLAPDSPRMHANLFDLAAAAKAGLLPERKGGPCIYLDTGHADLLLVQDPAGCRYNEQRHIVCRVARSACLHRIAETYGVAVGPWVGSLREDPPGRPTLDLDLVAAAAGSPDVARAVFASVESGVDAGVPRDFGPREQWSVWAGRFVRRNA